MPRIKDKLTPSETQLVKSKISGKTHEQAYREAYPNAKGTKATAVANTDKVLKRPRVQQAIDDALAEQNLTPQYVIGKLKDIVDQDKEIGAKRLAIRDVLELHGYQKSAPPNLTINTKQAFFKQSSDR